MRTTKEWAALLNGREYRSEVTKEEASQAKADGVVIVFGASDDLMEFEGAIYDELDCYGGREVAVTKDGLPVNKCPDRDCPYFMASQDHAPKIESIWDTEGYSWVYKTDIPHETFDILEDGEKYCRGIVFRLDEVPA